MLDFLDDRISARKFRLFAVACGRRQWLLFPPIPHRQVINAVEQFADGAGTGEELETLVAPLRGRYTPGSTLTREQEHLAGAACSLAFPGAGSSSVWRQALQVAQSVSEAVSARLGDYAAEFHESERELHPQIAILHDIAGHPFYPEAVEPAWLTSTVVQLSRAMYESRAFSARPILADALQDAGCDNDIILGHCQGMWTHTRGCWVVDLVLGKT